MIRRDKEGRSEFSPCFFLVVPSESKSESGRAEIGGGKESMRKDRGVTCSSFLFLVVFTW